MWTRALVFFAMEFALALVSPTVLLGLEVPAKLDSLAKDYLVGNWSVDGRRVGLGWKGAMSVRVSAGGKCLMFTWTLRASNGTTIHGAALGGRDPKTKELVEYCFESDDSHFTNRFPSTGIGDQGINHGERTGTLQGKAYKGKITVERKNRNQFVYSVVSAAVEDTQLVFRRMEVGKVKKTKP